MCYGLTIIANHSNAHAEVERLQNMYAPCVCVCVCVHVLCVCVVCVCVCVCDGRVQSSRWAKLDRQCVHKCRAAKRATQR